MIKIESIKNEQNDLMVVNAARVSMNKRKEKFDKDDEKLIRYLMKHRHFSPFYHVNFVFQRCMNLADFVSYSIATQNDQLNRSLAIVNGPEVNFVESGSLMAYLKQARFDKEIENVLSYKCPVSLEAYRKNYKSIVNDEYNVISCKIDDFNWPLEVHATHSFHTHEINIPLFVARQWFKHQIGFARNEVSRRYTSDELEFYNVEMRLKPEKSIKQGSGRVADLNPEDYNMLIANTTYSQKLYNYLLSDIGVAPECARTILPQNMMVKFIETGRLLAYMRLLSLRQDSHAQEEIRDSAHLLNEVLELSVGKRYNDFHSLYDTGMLKELVKQEEKRECS